MSGIPTASIYDGHVATENLRDTFACAALTGLLSNVHKYQNEPLTRQAFEIADFMLRERERTSVGAAGVAPVADRKSVATHGACARPCSQSFDSAPTTDQERGVRFQSAVMNWISEATSVYTPHSKIMEDACCRCWDAFDRIAYPDHDAAPAARACDGSVGTDKAEPLPVVCRAGNPPSNEGTGDTPADLDATQPRNGALAEPVAWAVMPRNSDYCVTLSTRSEAAQKAAERKVEVGEYATIDDIAVVPLYRSPTLADAEREFLQNLSGAYEELANQTGYVNAAAQKEAREHAATLRGLLERLGGER